MFNLGDATRAKAALNRIAGALAPAETKERYKVEDFFIAFIPLSGIVCAFLFLYMPHADFLPVIRGF